MQLKLRVGLRWMRGLTFLITVLALAAVPAYAAGKPKVDPSAVAQDARLGGDLTRTRFVADLSDAVDFRAFVLANPYRVIVDLPEVKFLMPSGVGSKGKGLVGAFRFGLFAAGKSRIVIDVVEPVRIDKAFVRAAENGQPARLVIDLVRTSPEEFEKLQRKQAALRSVTAGGFETNTEKLGAASPRATPEMRKNKPVIVLDPGHGGVDPGATFKLITFATPAVVQLVILFFHLGQKFIFLAGMLTICRLKSSWVYYWTFEACTNFTSEYLVG